MSSQLVPIEPREIEIIQPGEEGTLQPVQEPDLDLLLEKFLAAQDVAASSKATYKRQLRQFRLWLQETGRSLFQMTREDVLAYKKELLASKSSYSVSGYLTVVRKLFEWLEGERIYPNVAKGVKGAKTARGFRKDTLTRSQLRLVLEEIDTSSLEGLRDYALFNLLARTGLRTVEASRATVGDLRQEAGQAVLYVQGKGRDTKDEFVLVTDQALQPLRKYLSVRGAMLDEEPLFCSHSDRNRGQALTTRSISRIVKQALRSVGLDNKRLTAHSLRHTAITLSIIGGASLEQAQAMARHSDPATTMIYFHNLNRIKAGAELKIDF